MAVAASLRGIALALTQEVEATRPGIDIEPIFGASSAHARQLELGAPLDLLVSADVEIVERLAARQLVAAESIRDIAQGELALVERRGAFAADAGLAALDSSALSRIAIPPAAVPLGRYARHWLQARDLMDGLEGRIVATEHAIATLSAVEAGHVDLAIVYRSDARLVESARVIARIDSAEHPSIRYVVARAARAPRCPTIDVVMEAWTSDSARRHFADAGFVAPFESVRPSPASEG